MMRVLLLGGTGAMGLPLIEFLSEEGHQVYVSSRRQRHSHKNNVHYIVGNAMDDNFLREVLSERYDAIVDFMHYHPDKLQARLNLLLDHTEHYFYLSSCRAYAPSDSIITEDSPRLLEWADDKQFLASNEYALSKARCENLLRDSGRKNWTSIRPYITYNTERIQLSIFEKEGWLYRALKGRSIVFCKDLATKRTTLTLGDDVARAIAIMITDKTGFGEIVHITGEDSMTWREVLNLYCDILEKKTGKKPSVKWLEDSNDLSKIIGNTYKTRYDRLSNRVFDNSKAQQLCSNKLSFTPMREGLTNVVSDFIDGKQRFKDYNWSREAYLDKQAGEFAKLSEFKTMRVFISYFLNRFCRYYKRKLKIKDVGW